MISLLTSSRLQEPGAEIKNRNQKKKKKQAVTKVQQQGMMNKRIACKLEEWTMSFRNRLDIYYGTKKVAMDSNERVVFLPVVKLVTVLLVQLTRIIF